MNGEGQECGHTARSMFLAITTSHLFLRGLALPLGWPQSCLFHIPVSEVCSFFPHPKPGPLPLPWTAHAAWLPSHPPPITSPYPQVLILGVQISNFSFKLLSQSEGPCPGHLGPSPPCPCRARLKAPPFTKSLWALQSLFSLCPTSPCTFLVLAHTFFAAFTIHQPLHHPLFPFLLYSPSFLIKQVPGNAVNESSYDRELYPSF